MSASRGTNRYRDPSRFVSPVSVPFDEALSNRQASSEAILFKDNTPSRAQYTRSPPNKALLISNDHPTRPLDSSTTRYAGVTSWNTNNGFLGFVARPCAANTTDSVLPYDLEKTDSLKSLEDFLSVAENNPYTLIKDRRDDSDPVSSPVEERDQLAECSEEIVVTSSSSSEDVFAGIIAAEKMNNDKVIGRDLRVNSSSRKMQHQEGNSLALSSGLPTARLSNVKNPKDINQAAFSSEIDIEEEILTHRRIEGFVDTKGAITKYRSDDDGQTVTNQANNVELTLEDFEKNMEVTVPNSKIIKSAPKASSVAPSVNSNSSKSFVLKPLSILKKSLSKLRFGYRRKKRKEVIKAEPMKKDWSGNSKPSSEQPMIHPTSSSKPEPTVDFINTLPTLSTKNSTVSVPEIPGQPASMILDGRRSRSHRHRISVTNASQSFASEKSEANNPAPSRPRQLKGYIDDCSIVFSRSDFSYLSEYSHSYSDCSSDYSDDDSLFDNPSKAVAQTASELLNPGSLRVLQEEFVAMFGKPVTISKRRR